MTVPEYSSCLIQQYRSHVWHVTEWQFYIVAQGIIDKECVSARTPQECVGTDTYDFE